MLRLVARLNVGQEFLVGNPAPRHFRATWAGTAPPAHVEATFKVCEASLLPVLAP